MLCKTECFTESMSLFETSGTTSQVNNLGFRMEFSMAWETIKRDEIYIWWIEQTKELSHIFKKKGASPHLLIETFKSGRLENSMHWKCPHMFLIKKMNKILILSQNILCLTF